uniref:Uncharacterized protein n=1 Tax=Salix viminalis TaxID=40686 RepID=A0A6N2N3N1_SALVM
MYFPVKLLQQGAFFRILTILIRLSTTTHLYECDYKPYTNNSNGLYFRDNFQGGGGCWNLPQKNLIDITGPNQSHMSLNLQEIKPMN